MQPKIESLRWSSSTINMAGITIFLIIIFFLTLNWPVSSSYVKPVSFVSSQILSSQTSVSFPIRLKIPKIGIDASVISVGITPQGAMDVSKSPADVAWFNLGPRPGESGSAVIAGHYGWKNGIPAAFDNLSKLRKGDKIYVKDEKGTTAVFVVRELQIYGENENVSSVFSSNDGKARLNLITCGGVWDKIRKSYSNRLVVFTDMA